MKCNNCGEDLVIPDGKEAGHCVHCGASFKVEESSGKQTLDDSIIDRIADRVVEKIEAKRTTKKGGKSGKAKKKPDEEGDGDEGNGDEGAGEDDRWAK